MTALSPEIVELEPQQCVAVRGEVRYDEMAAFFERAFTQAREAAIKAGVEVVGPPFGHYPEQPTADSVVIEAGMPVATRIEEAGPAHPLVLPGGRAVTALHVGSYDTLPQTYAAVAEWIAGQGLEHTAGPWESYLDDPVTEPDPTRRHTQVFFPIT